MYRTPEMNEMEDAKSREEMADEGRLKQWWNTVTAEIAKPRHEDFSQALCESGWNNTNNQKQRKISSVERFALVDCEQSGGKVNETAKTFSEMKMFPLSHYSDQALTMTVQMTNTLGMEKTPQRPRIVGFEDPLGAVCWKRVTEEIENLGTQRYTWNKSDATLTLEKDCKYNTNKMSTKSPRKSNESTEVRKTSLGDVEELIKPKEQRNCWQFISEEIENIQGPMWNLREILQQVSGTQNLNENLEEKQNQAHQKNQDRGVSPNKGRCSKGAEVRKKLEKWQTKFGDLFKPNCLQRTERKANQGLHGIANEKVQNIPVADFGYEEITGTCGPATCKEFEDPEARQCWKKITEEIENLGEYRESIQDVFQVQYAEHYNPDQRDYARENGLVNVRKHYCSGSDDEILEMNTQAIWYRPFDDLQGYGSCQATKEEAPNVRNQREEMTGLTEGNQKCCEKENKENPHFTERQTDQAIQDAEEKLVWEKNFDKPLGMMSLEDALEKEIKKIRDQTEDGVYNEIPKTTSEKDRVKIMQPQQLTNKSQDPQLNILWQKITEEIETLVDGNKSNVLQRSVDGRVKNATPFTGVNCPLKEPEHTMTSFLVTKSNDGDQQPSWHNKFMDTKFAVFWEEITKEIEHVMKNRENRRKLSEVNEDIANRAESWNNSEHSKKSHKPTVGSPSVKAEVVANSSDTSGIIRKIEDKRRVCWKTVTEEIISLGENMSPAKIKKGKAWNRPESLTSPFHEENLSVSKPSCGETLTKDSQWTNSDSGQVTEHWEEILLRKSKEIAAKKASLRQQISNSNQVLNSVIEEKLPVARVQCDESARRLDDAKKYAEKVSKMAQQKLQNSGHLVLTSDIGSSDSNCFPSSDISCAKFEKMEMAPTKITNSVKDELQKEKIGTKDIYSKENSLKEESRLVSSISSENADSNRRVDKSLEFKIPKEILLESKDGDNSKKCNDGTQIEKKKLGNNRLIKGRIGAETKMGSIQKKRSLSEKDSSSVPSKKICALERIPLPQKGGSVNKMKTLTFDSVNDKKEKSLSSKNTSLTLHTKSTSLPTKNNSLPTNNTSLPTKSGSLPIKSTSFPSKSCSVPTKTVSLSTKNSSSLVASASLPNKSSSLPSGALATNSSSLSLKTKSSSLPTKSTLLTKTNSLPPKSSSLTIKGVSLCTKVCSKDMQAGNVKDKGNNGILNADVKGKAEKIQKNCNGEIKTSLPKKDTLPLKKTSLNCGGVKTLTIKDRVDNKGNGSISENKTGRVEKKNVLPMKRDSDKTKSSQSRKRSLEEKDKSTVPEKKICGGSTPTARGKVAEKDNSADSDKSCANGEKPFNKGQNLREGREIHNVKNEDTDSNSQDSWGPDTVLEDTELIQQAKKRWGCDVIPSPETNLTCANFWRRNRRGKAANKRAVLEGYHRYSPLIEKLMTRDGKDIYNQIKKRKRPYNDTFVEPGDGCQRDGKRPKFETQDNGSYGQAAVVSLQEQLKKSEKSFKQRFQDVHEEQARRKSKLQKEHDCTVSNLQRQQQHAMKKLYSNCYDNCRLHTPLVNMRNQHASQLKRLKDDFQRDLATLEEETKKKIYEERKAYSDIEEQLQQLSRQASRCAPDVPYKTFSLDKAPCRQNNFRKSSAHVFLPSDIAAAMIQEDLIYDSFYKY